MTKHTVAKLNFLSESRIFFSFTNINFRAKIIVNLNLTFLESLASFSVKIQFFALKFKCTFLSFLDESFHFSTVCNGSKLIQKSVVKDELLET